MSTSTIRTSLALAGALLAATAAPGRAPAAEIAPAAAGDVALGPLSGVAYYTVEPKGYRVVVTVSPRGAGPALRMEAVLGAGQGVTLSTPRMPDEAAQTVAIERVGDRVFVSGAAPAGPVLEAEAGH